MLIVDKDNTIHLTRGDTARFSIGQIVNTITNTNYTPTAEDTVTMTIKKTVLQADPCVQIIVPGGEVLEVDRHVSAADHAQTGGVPLDEPEGPDGVFAALQRRRYTSGELT